AHITAYLSANSEERIVARCRAVGIEPENHPSVVGRVRLRAAELVVSLPRAEGTVGQVLRLAATALIADLEVELAVGAEENLTAVMVAAHRLAGVRLERP